jgi:signal transduction histidine kinase
VPSSSRRGAVFDTGDIPHVRDGRTTAASDAATLTSGDNGGMTVRQLAASALLGLLAVAELAARLAAGSTVRAGLVAGPVTHTGVSALTALLMCAFCLLATVPAVLLRPAAATAAVYLAAMLSLVLFELATAAGAAALLIVAYRLARGGSKLLAAALAVPFLGVAVAAVAASWPAQLARAHGLTIAGAETRVLAVLLAALIPVAALAGMARRAREDSQTHSAVRELTAGVLAEHLARGERARIARDLHDVVAHHISMIAVQAETARLTTPGLPDAGAQRFAAIGETARAGLTEMRRLLGVLREDAQAGRAWPEPGPQPDRRLPPDRRPQPGLPQLAELVDEAREASGSAARLIVSGPVGRLDPGVELAAFRIVQEALTNARRHAPGAAVDVELRFSADALRLLVRDNGPGSLDDVAAIGPAGRPLASGTAGRHGLLGMRERAAAAGGTLHAGNAPGGGFCVGTELPVTAPDGLTGAA